MGSIITGFDNVSEIYREVINALEIPEEDINEDPFLSVYRYNRPLTLNKVSKKNGGIITILPDIHEMNGSDLVRLNRVDNYSSLDDINKFLVYTAWYKNVSGRQGWGIKKDSTFIESGVLEGYLKENYGAFPAGEINIAGPILKYKSNPRLVTLNDNVTPVVNWAYGSKNSAIEAGVITNELGPITELGTKYIEGGTTDGLGLFI